MTAPTVRSKTRRPRRTTTIAQIAAQTGVSVPTVSKVINGRSDVAPETRLRVEAAIRDAGYQRPPRTTRRAPLLEVIFHELESEWALEIVRGVERVAGQHNLAVVLSELRLIKDDHEIAQLSAAITATVLGFEDVIRELPRAIRTSERWIEGTFDRRARLAGNDVGYGSICACGPHATTLHWVHNDGVVRPGELMLLDMGVESRELYTADVTRTLPINGRWTEPQRRVYDVVHRAQRAAVEAVRPGVDFLEPHRVAMRVIAATLEEWGILPVSAEESLQKDSGLHQRYTLHGTSHMLGLDVHDCASARSETYRDGTLAPGMVLTVEPGLYFQPDDLTVPAELRGIGVRIEDDVLVTDTGRRNLSEALPRDPDEVERWMAALLPG